MFERIFSVIEMLFLITGFSSGSCFVTRIEICLSAYNRNYDSLDAIFTFDGEDISICVSDDRQFLTVGDS